MSTKRLSRTVIEGGRERRNTWERRESNRVARAQERAMLHALRADPEGDVPPPMRWIVYKFFADKLGPAERWLAKQAGRPWRVVEGEIFARFDTRNLASRHIVVDHLLPRGHSPREGWRVSRRWFFHEDEAGTLRVSREPPPTLRWSWYGRERPHAPWFSPRAAAFVGDRRIGTRGPRFYWLLPTGSEAPGAEPFRRQGHALTPVERANYSALCVCERLAITIALP